MRVLHKNGKVSESTFAHHDQKRGIAHGFVSNATRDHERAAAKAQSDYVKKAAGNTKAMDDADFMAEPSNPKYYGR